MSEDKYIKLKLICSEVQSSLKKIREILTPTLSSQKIQYLPLTPIQNADEDKAYTEMLTYAVSQQDINNIAITGPYGAGKSSVILTFQKFNPQWNYLNISLATFKDSQEDEQYKNIDIETIEKSILQQLLYTVRQKDIPKSRLKRIETIKTTELFKNTIFIISWIFSTLVIFSPSNEIFKKFNSLNPITDIINQIATIIFCLFSATAIFLALKYLERVKELKLKFQDSEIILNNDNHESILNKYLDEILYFFEQTDFDVIVIEDLDRFDNTEIFIRLRELNTLINKSQQIKRHITFIYAIRDNMFKDKDRSKFFDFIIPIIPVINPTNAYDLIKKNYINEDVNKELNNEIDDIFLHQISLYFDDLRLVTNIFNEFELYVKKLNNPNLNKNKLLAIIIYKNYYPSEFANLHKNKGEIYYIFKELKPQLIEKLSYELQNEVKIIDNDLKEGEKETLNSLDDLKRLYIYEIQKKTPQITSVRTEYYNAVIAQYNLNLYADDEPIDVENMLDDEIFTLIKNAKTLEWSINNSEQTVNTTIINNNNVFNFSEIEKSLGYKDSYEKRKKIITNKQNSIKEQILNKRKLLIERINYLQHSNLKEILEKNTLIFFDETKHPKLLQFLVREGYIDENYPDYISFFFNSVINFEERDYAQRVLNQVNSEFDQSLINVEKVLKRYLTARQFSHTSILNFDMIDYILNNKNEFQDHYFNLFNLLSNEEDRSKKFIVMYIDRGRNLSEFINSITIYWENFFENFPSSQMSDEQVNHYLKLILKSIYSENIEKLNKNKSLRDYISVKKDFINFIKDIYSNTPAKISEFLSSTSPNFEYLDCSPNDLDLFNEICENEYFSFNKRMILQILLLNNSVEDHSEIQRNFDSMPYGIPQKFLPTYLKLQIDASIDHYFEEVIVPLAITLNENSDNFIRLLNKDNLSTEHKEWLIKNNNTQIPNIKDIQYFDLWNCILNHYRLTPTWDSLIFYFESKEFNLDDALINYINTSDVHQELQKFKIPDYKDLENLNDASKKFQLALLKENTLNISAYECLIKSRYYIYRTLDISELSDDKILLLCKNKILMLTNENFGNLRVKSSNILIEFLSQYQHSGLIDKICDEFEISNEEFEIILSSNRFNKAFKKSLSDKLGSTLFSRSDNIKKYIIELYNDLTLALPLEYIDIYFTSTLSNMKKLELLIDQIKYLSKEALIKYLTQLHSPYNEIIVSGRHVILLSDINTKLTLELEKINFIHKKEIKEYKIAQDKIVFYTK